MRIDSHQHFWKYDPERYNWITDDMSAIRKDFSPPDLQPALQQYGFEGCVAVQSHESKSENTALLEVAKQYPFIKGIVGWLDFQAFDVEEQLAEYARFKTIKGFRYVLQGNEDRGLMLTPVFKKNIGLLSKYGFTYDLLILPDQLRYAYQLAVQLPYQSFVIDHIAKPPIKKGEIADWKRDISMFAKLENVYCKVSGMVTEAEPATRKPEDFEPYLDVVTHTFGTKRIMYGSDWPVCLAATDYGTALNITGQYFSSFSQDEKESFFGENATRFYKL